MMFIGLDVGTTATKAVVTDREGHIYGKGYFEYELTFPAEGQVEQNAEDWWTAATKAIRQAVSTVDIPDEIVGIGLSTQGATLVAVDEKGIPLAPAITWMDHRATEQASALDKAIGADAVYHKTGWRLSPAADAAKIRWLQEKRPELFHKTAYFISTLEFMNYQLCGRFVIDPTNAAIRQLLNIHTGQWDPEILDFIGITPDRLPEVHPVGHVIGNLTSEAAKALGLSTNVQVFNGAHDQYCAALGSGAVHTGDMLLATGTTWVVLGVTDRPMFTSSYIAPGIHPVKNRYGAMASLVSAGSALKWYRKIAGEDFATIDDEAATRTRSAADLLFYPYLCGAGFPHGKPEIRGSLMGLDLHHDKYDIARALMEGVAFETALTLEQFSAQGMGVHRLMMTGGASKSLLWSQLVGYITGCEIYRMKEPDTGCVGAAMIAAVGCTAFTNYEEASTSMVHAELLPLPDTDLPAFYKEKGARYRKHLEQAHTKL